MSKRDYYCNQKFNWLQLSITDGHALSCCDATSYKLDLDRLKNNKHEIFNTPEMVQDRVDMLENKRVVSCESCWKNEDNGIASRRTQHGRSKKTHFETFQLPEKLHILLGNDCNQACVYCGAGYSSTWARIIQNNEDLYSTIQGYGDTYKLNKFTQAKLKLGQKKLYKNAWTSILLEQIKNNSANVKEISFSGGEPLLDNNLIEILKFLYKDCYIRILTGLTVSDSRLKNMLESIKNIDIEVEFEVSAENINGFHNFNRFGSNFEDFERKYNLIKEYFPANLSSTISCTTAIGFREFCDYFHKEKIVPHHVSNPDMLLLSNLDPTSKEILKEEWQSIRHIENVDDYIKMLDIPAIKTRELKHYLDIYAKTRNLDLGIFPQHFLDFLQQKG